MFAHRVTGKLHALEMHGTQTVGRTLGELMWIHWIKLIWQYFFRPCDLLPNWGTIVIGYLMPQAANYIIFDPACYDLKRIQSTSM